jgi:sugar O-acyltransferase (sialic acid O-acetyltransferase NeuD family)
MQLAVAGVDLVNVIHPSAVVSPFATVERGSVIFANAVVNACATLGIGSIVNTGAVVEHDCVVGEFCHISPNAVLAGGVKLDARVWVGACSSVRQLVRIGEEAVVGMGSVVTKNIPSRVTVIGNPAKILASSKK